MYDIEYEKPSSIEEALKLKQKWGKDGLIIAGGSNVLVYLKDRKIHPRCFIDLSELEALRQITINDLRVSVGPSVRIAEIEESKTIQQHAYILFQTAREFANPLIKNKATIGGNIADASPAADMAPSLLVLDAEIELSSQDGKRKIPIRDFFIGPRKTVVHENEIITDISFNSMANGYKSDFIKLGNRNATTIAVVSIAMLLSISKEKINLIRVALGSVAPRPVRAYQTEKLCTDRVFNSELLKESMLKIPTETNPISDIRASALYRKEMSAVLFKRVLQHCTGGNA